MATDNTANSVDYQYLYNKQLAAYIIQRIFPDNSVQHTVLFLN
jgi:hypothetical protein